MAVALDFGEIVPYAGVFAKGAWFTVKLAVATSVCGVAMGVLGAIGRNSGNSLVRFAATSYVELVRNTPFLVQLFFIFFGLPGLGIKINAEAAAFIAMTLNLGGYSTEIIRAGIESIHRGQTMAAISLGLTRVQAFLHVVLKPAFANVYPALVSQLVLVMLGSAVVSQIAAEDLSFAANFVQSRNFRAFEAYMTSTAIYLLLAIAMRQSLFALGRHVFSWQGARR